ncbi:MAG: flagellar protein export ATPase FliI [Eubacteriales bacterium]|nr:flagellar protein export ATPase FliI [Eubacteriales bacterium]
MNISLKKYIDVVKDAETIRSFGRVTGIVGLMVESLGPSCRIGEQCYIYSRNNESFIPAEVVGLRDKTLLLMPFGDLDGVGYGSRVVAAKTAATVGVGMNLVGRVLDGLGNPIDGLGRIETKERYKIENQPPNPLTRKPIKEVLPLGVRALDGFLTCGKGQRIGIFAGSGVGKSTLLGMIARNTTADVNVIVLVGERGRELNEFIANDLKEEGLKKSVVVVATSDQPALIRIKSAMVGTAIAEYFRDQGKNVMLLVDSLTRFAMAQREIGLAVGEPPVTRGYTPSVFSMMPKLLERAGNSDKGSITGLYTVLVDGDDLNEPISDTVRGILDGHIVLSREIANRNHYPAIDVLGSVSRLMPAIVDKQHMNIVKELKNLMAAHRQAQDLINIGAYKKGSNEEIDRAIRLIKPINNFLKQDIDQTESFEEVVSKLNQIYEEKDIS